MATIHHELTIDSPASRVYEAIANPERIGTWWDKHTATQTERGLVLEHNPGPEHGPVQFLVLESIPDRLIEWECISHHPTSSPASPWTGTRFRFELEPRNAGRATKLDFRQLGYDERSPFFASNTTAWGQVLESLKRTVEGQRR